MSDIRKCKEQLKDLFVNMVRDSATKDEMEKVVQYSIAVLDANKLYEDNEIAELEAKYCMSDEKRFDQDHRLTPEEFLVCLKRLWLQHGNDKERAHIAMDYLMCNLLESLGYGEGVEFFIKCEKWYS